MSDIARGSHADVVLTPGQVLRVSTVTTATVKSEFGASVNATVSAASQDFGPYSVATKLAVNAVGSRAHSDLVAPDMRAVVFSAAAPDNNDGRPEGTIWIQP